MVRVAALIDEQDSLIIHLVGILRDGGYAEYCTLRSEAVVSVPEDMDPTEAAPILCAGVTCFSEYPLYPVTSRSRILTRSIRRSSPHGRDASGVGRCSGHWVSIYYHLKARCQDLR